MIAKISPAPLCGEIIAPPSKSFAHRLMIAASLSGGEKTVRSVGESKDVLATARVLKSLGADCGIINGVFVSRGFGLNKNAVLDCGESGSTLRFFIPIAAALGADATFTGTKKLLSRPCLPLIECLERGGVREKNFSFRGKLKGGRLVADASVSSQYVTGLLLASPLIEEDCEIIVTGREVSKPYIEITLSVLKDSGITVEKTENGFFIKGGQKYALYDNVRTEGDWSGAAFALAAGAIGGSVTVSGLNPKSLQGDAAVAEILKRFGAEVTFGTDSVSAAKPRRGKLTAQTIDCENVPDLAQIISVVAAFAEGRTELRGIENLKYKESDRIAAIINTLTAAGIKSETDGKSLFVYGGSPKGFRIDSGNDHRTAMSAAVLACYAEGESAISAAEAVEKSYPRFYEDVKKLGGKVYVGF